MQVPFSLDIIDAAHCLPARLLDGLQSMKRLLPSPLARANVADLLKRKYGQHQLLDDENLTPFALAPVSRISSFPANESGLMASSGSSALSSSSMLVLPAQHLTHASSMSSIPVSSIRPHQHLPHSHSSSVLLPTSSTPTPTLPTSARACISYPPAFPGESVWNTLTCGAQFTNWNALEDAIDQHVNYVSLFFFFF